MAEVVKMPRLSDTMTEGVVVKWHKKVGEIIKEGDLLADIETDKATMEFESFQEGVLLYIGVQENETAEVDAVLAILGDKNEDITTLLDGNIASKKEIKIEDSVASIESNESEKISHSNEILLKNRGSDSSIESRIKISPLAKKIAIDNNIDLTNISGTGDGGRIIKRDLDKITAHHQDVIVNHDKLKSEEVPVSQMRKTIASRLSQSKFTAPHFYLNIQVNMDNLIESRNLLNKKNDVKISFNDILVKAVSMAIKKHPLVNSSWHNDHIKLHKDVNIGVAVSVENGLLVPVIKNADVKSFSAIAQETKLFVQKANDNQLQPNDWEGNTFTISNLGMFGIEDFTAIINSPDACILAVGAIKERPVVKDGKIVPGNIMKLTLSCDHRIVDGVIGAKFLQTLKDMLESPLMMFS